MNNLKLTVLVEPDSDHEGWWRYDVQYSENQPVTRATGQNLGFAPAVDAALDWAHFMVTGEVQPNAAHQ